MAQQRSTFAKLQRDRDKKERATLKAERRAQRAPAVEATPPATDRPTNETEILAALAELHAALDAETVSMDEFETRRTHLLSQLQIG